MSLKIDKLRWGVLGVAKINERLFPSFRNSKTAELAAIASRDAARSRAAADEAGIPKAYGSYDELLDDPAIQAVYIPLPNHLHAEYVKKAADRGKHVLCEKPLCPSAPEAAELAAYCKSRKIRLMDGFMWPHHPRTAVIRKLLDSGKIGEVKRVTAAFTFTLENLDPSNIRMHREWGGGSLLDVGCYCVYGIRWAMGREPVKTFARANYKNDCDVEMTGQLLFADGSLASFDCGFTAPMRQWMEITGTKGTLTVPEMWVPDNDAVFEIRIGSDVETHHVKGMDQIQCMIDDFGMAVIENRDPVPTTEQAIGTLKVLDALANSAREGREVDV